MDELTAAVQAARQAGRLLRENFARQHQIMYKGVIDLVTEMDQEAEALITTSLRQSFPDYGFLGEEGSRAEGNGKACWIIDPIDGTTNYAHGYPFFAVSIALEVQGEITVGVVYNPMLDELFTAQKGKGAFLNGEAIRVTSTADIARALLASGFPYDVWTNPINNCRQWEKAIRRTISVRCDGAASIDLAYVAAGRIDGYWELDLEAWDMAAGVLLVQEAGGRVSQCFGEDFSINQRNVLASNGSLHPALRTLLNDD
ncbi:MAG: inositol monophosphatase [Chloroflexi bacterium]|nr:inositol monophosphatase [Chloroflexota bacterium]